MDMFVFLGYVNNNTADVSPSIPRSQFTGGLAACFQQSSVLVEKVDFITGTKKIIKKLV